MRTSKKITLAAALLAQLPALHAATINWTGASDGNWATVGNWSPNFPAAADTALFTTNTNTAVNLTANTSIQSIQFGTSSVGSFTFSGSKFISNGSGATITVLNTVTGSPTITFNNEIQVTPSSRPNSAGYTISNNSTTASLVLNGNIYGGITTPNISATLSLRGTGTAGQNSSMVINGVISDGVAGGRLAVLKTGGASQGGTVTLNGANTYSGGTEFGNASGSLVLGNKSALGTSSLRIVGGSGILSANTNLTGSNAVANTIDYYGSLSSTATTTSALLNYAANSNVATLVSGTAPLVGDLITGGNSQLPINTRVIAVNGNQITLSENAALTASNVTATTTPYASGGSGTFTIGGTNNIELSGTQNLTSAWSNGTAATQNFNITNTGVTTFSGVLQQLAGVASITKSGTGVLVLSGANTYSGNTTVTGGTLLLNSQTGSATGTSGQIVVNTGATLGGNGRTSSLIQINSGASFRIGGSTGSSTGLLTSTNSGFSALVLAAGSTTVFDINGTTKGVNYDAFKTDGRVSYGGDFSVSFGSLTPGGTTIYDLFDFSSVGLGTNFNSFAITGLYTANLAVTGAGGTAVWTGTALDGTMFSFSQATGDLTVSAIPEPSAFAALAGLATLGLAATRRRRTAA